MLMYYDKKSIVMQSLVYLTHFFVHQTMY